MKAVALGLLAALCLAGRAWAAGEVQMQSSSFDSDGVKIAYIEAGSGDPIVLVHGLYSSARMNWVLPGTFGMLAQHHHVIAMDLRGHGNSDKPTDESAYGQPMVEDIARLMDHLNIPKAQIVGYSIGGVIVMKFMVDHPERVRAAALGGIAWLRNGSVEQRAFEGLGSPGASGTPPACAHGIAKLAVTEEHVKGIHVPVEVLVGDHDPCKRLYVDPLGPVRPDWPVVVIDGAGHINCIVKDQFKNGLASWIGKNAN
jgi:pimeloyl-ACP methyl ester carboxylesterase